MQSNLFDLTGKVAFVSGAGQGVGAAIASRLAERGAMVAVNDISPERATAVAEAIVVQGGIAMAAPADVTDREQIGRAIQVVADAFGPVDILVNNAGVPPEGFSITPFGQTSRKDWDRYIDINVYGVMYSAHAVLESMQSRGYGRIITIVSDSGRYGEPNMAAYAASKAAAAGFMRALAKEAGPAGITCNSLSLGSIEPPPELRSERDEKRARFYPMRRLGRPDDIAGAVVYLASDEAGWVTGQTISINGGYVAN
jgi:NAD(P)-dependent dehydrogenase (short-subunit alcohol dehydrogenase family)